MNTKNALYPLDTCYFCGSPFVEIHHIFNKYNKKNSEKYGAIIGLCRKHHNEPPDGVHFNKARREELQADAQRRIMQKYEMTVEDFISIFGKNYMEE